MRTPNILADDVLGTGIFDWHLVPASNPVPPFRSFPHFFTPQGSVEQNWTVNEGAPPPPPPPPPSLFIPSKEPVAHYLGGWVDCWKDLDECGEEENEWSPDFRHEAHILGTMLIYVRRNYAYLVYVMLLAVSSNRQFSAEFWLIKMVYFILRVRGRQPNTYVVTLVSWNRTLDLPSQLLYSFVSFVAPWTLSIVRRFEST